LDKITSIDYNLKIALLTLGARIAQWYSAGLWAG
jgi:hypothetical protein